MADLSVLNGAAVTMSSREIAELTGKETSHVHRDIRSMLEQLSDDPELDHVREDKDARGYTVCFHLTKNLSMTLVAGYNVKLRKAIIDRWQELEAKAAGPALPDFTNPAAAARAWADAIEQRQLIEAQAEQARQQLALAAPKVEALDRIAKADGSTCITDAAKVLQVRPKDLFSWLQAHQWIYRRPGGSGWLAYQNRIQQGYLEHKVTTVERGDGSEKVIEAVRVTRKGLTRLAEEFSSLLNAA